jgi:thiol-disulfide isomerase/thioredoxin
MRSRTGRILAAAALVLGGLAIASVEAQDKPRRSAEQILKEIDAVKPPAIPQNREDQNAVREYITKMTEARQKRGELIGELYKADPENAKLAKLLPERWQTMSPVGPGAEELARELDDILAHSSNEPLKIEAAFTKARVEIVKNREKPAAALPAIEEFIKRAPKDQRASQLVYAASTMVEDKALKTELEERLVNEFADSPYAGMIKGLRKQREAIGKPFELEFQDAIKGETVSIKGLKGKVVVLDFWATWCGPCVAEMPTMKKLYAEYKDKGVEFIGVSLDQPKEQGGLDKLKDFVEKNELTWPQYYQGNYWQSEFSSGWGINSIPCVFVVDQEGKLYSTEARGKLEEMIPELLAKKKAAAEAGGQ